jgi:hypothetical protein
LDAERALSSQCALPWLGTKYEYELGRKFRCWVDLLADDGVLDACLDIYNLCYCMRSRVALHLAYIPRNKGIIFGGDGNVACGWLGREGKFEKTRGKKLGWSAWRWPCLIFREKI